MEPQRACGSGLGGRGLSSAAATTTTTTTTTNSRQENMKSSKSYNLRIKSLQNRIEVERRKREPRHPKPKQRPPPLSKYRRKTANLRERYRMQEMNDAFRRLQSVVPDVFAIEDKDKDKTAAAAAAAGTSGTNNNNNSNSSLSQSKLTKINTLKLAVNYISALTQMLQTQTGSSEQGKSGGAGATSSMSTSGQSCAGSGKGEMTNFILCNSSPPGQQQQLSADVRCQTRSMQGSDRHYGNNNNNISVNTNNNNNISVNNNNTNISVNNQTTMTMMFDNQHNTYMSSIYPTMSYGVDDNNITAIDGLGSNQLLGSIDLVQQQQQPQQPQHYPQHSQLLPECHLSQHHQATSMSHPLDVTVPYSHGDTYSLYPQLVPAQLHHQQQQQQQPQLQPKATSGVDDHHSLECLFDNLDAFLDDLADVQSDLPSPLIN